MVDKNRPKHYNELRRQSCPEEISIMNSVDNIGLTYIRKLYNYSMQELAERMIVSKQTVSKWESKKKPITAERINQLSKLFIQDERYFTESLTKTDELRIQQRKLANEEDELKLTQVIEDGEGNEIEIPLYINSNQIEDLSDEISKNKIIEEVRQIMRKVKYREIEESGIYGWNVVTRFQQFIDIIKSEKINDYSLWCILKSIDIVYGINKENAERYNSNEYIKELVNTMQNDRNEIHQRENTNNPPVPSELEGLFK